jgi:hypothetical protein
VIKQCPLCNGRFNVEDYGADRRCKSCCREKSKKYRKENSVKTRETVKKWRKANPQFASRATRKYRLKKLGLSQEDYIDLLVRQGGVCAVCKQTDKRALDVDHCHKTGVVRGLLCSACNKAEGLLKSDPNIIRALASYVEYNQIRNVT